MIKVSVMYPNTPGARFDHAYYRDKHMPLVKARMGDSCRFYTVDRGLAGAGPGEPATYVGMCHIYCESVESFQAGFGRMRRKSWPTFRTTRTRHPSSRLAKSLLVSRETTTGPRHGRRRTHDATQTEIHESTSHRLNSIRRTMASNRDCLRRDVGTRFGAVVER
jgi:uncharacterized protein (TIGR02118 family)